MFVYKMTVLPNVSTVLCNKIDKLIDNYLWNGRRAKISKITLRLAKKHGGLRLFDVERKQASLKLGWIPVMKENEFFRDCFFDCVNIPSDLGSLDYNISAKDAERYCDKKGFWGQTWIEWCRLTYKEPQNLNELLNVNCWYNSCLRIQGTPITNVKYLRSGILKVVDIFDANTRDGFKSYDKIRTRFKLSWLEYLSIQRAFPVMWKLWFKSKNTDTGDDEIKNVISLNSLPEQTKLANFFYKLLVTPENDQILCKYKIRWYDEEGIAFELPSFCESFKNLYKCTQVTKFRDFQYRLLINKLPTNVKTKLWGITDTDLCSFCNTKSESSKHMFLECKFVKRIWKFLMEHLEVTGELDISKLILNTVHENAKHITNLVTLITKQFIYRCRCKKERPSIRKVQQELLTWYNIEKYIAKKTLRVDNFNKKWSKIDFTIFAAQNM